MATEVTKERIWLHKDELLDSVRVLSDGKTRFYSYTYRLLGKKGHWRPAVRWDNQGQSPHIDNFDDKGNFLEQIPSRQKSLREVIKLVTIFRRNLLFMDLGEL